ncbi:MAG: substrate-binding domain-containing protein [Lachnospiraceae bacterium]|nr:substrate-binding domain-containing protein [Lachnospiraceae bacterium]
MKKTLLMTVLGAAMALMICGTAMAEEVSFEADANGDGKIVVGYISKNFTDPFHAPINARAKEYFDQAVKDGVIDEWTGLLDGETDPNKQIDRAADCISKQCDIVIFLPAEAEASDPALTQMADAGILVIEVNSKSASCDEKAIAYVGSDDVEAGNMLAQWVVDNCPDGGKFIHCNGVLGNSAQIQRTEGMHAIMDEHPEFEMVGDFDTKWDGNLAADAASDSIAKYGDELVAIICDNDGMSSAAQKMCNDSGREDIICIGVDGVEVPMQMVKVGSLKATILQDGVGQINGAIDIVEKLVAGESFDPAPVIPFVLITQDNVDDYMN